MAGAGSSAEVMKSTVCELSAAGLMGLLPGYYQHLSCLLLNKAGRSLCNCFPMNVCGHFTQSHLDKGFAFN